MTTQTADRIIRAISGERDDSDEVLYCTPNVVAYLESKMSLGIGNQRSVDGVRVAGLDIVEIPPPTNGQDVAVVCQYGEFLPIAEHYG